ncbi:glutamine--fructose-6-phosphate transaminase (isomerizing) [Porphyromonas miyakawae]|uniref:Glutamine--fructose-6-phosphate aminotransferase [isomerizing] n=1 Tax=Porphyromonas miyakawae TaxID=3137470 RepID=A0ABQ0E2N4_9PORP
MCGIVGYMGSKNAYPILIKGLQRLEYRGYDSAGVALLNANNELRVYKQVGKVAALDALAREQDITGSLGIAHTRWATHGEPSTVNAHPIYSQSKHIVIVHNGIIENYREIKSKFIELGYEFQSDTDTEVIVQLIEHRKQELQSGLFAAVKSALSSLIGAYAIAVVDKDEPDAMVVARNSSPLVIGVENNYSEFYIGSDSTPFLEYTRQVIYLRDGEIASLKLGHAPEIYSLKNEPVNCNLSYVDIEIGAIEKNGFEHFMLKEIFDQPRCLGDCLSGRISERDMRIKLSSFVDHGKQIASAERIVMVACGTSWHAALIGKQLIESLARVPVVVEYASEFRYRNAVILPHDVVIAISQSGETADTLAAVKLAKERGAFIYAICNVIGSSISREAHTGTYTHVGPEIGVASTKAFTGQVTVLTMFALSLAENNDTITTEKYEELVRGLLDLPHHIERILEQSEEVKEIAHVFADVKNFIYLGRGYNYPIALEGALKLKEISYIHAEGYPAAEMKHGPIALVDEHMPIVMIAPQDDVYDKIISNIQELKARKGRIIGIISEGDVDIQELTDYAIQIPRVAPELEAILSIIPLQLLSYYIAVCNGKDVDQPRNLAKSVTVE